MLIAFKHLITKALQGKLSSYMLCYGRRIIKFTHPEDMLLTGSVDEPRPFGVGQRQWNITLWAYVAASTTSKSSLKNCRRFGFLIQPNQIFASGGFGNHREIFYFLMGEIILIFLVGRQILFFFKTICLEHDFIELVIILSTFVNIRSEREIKCSSCVTI